jgi:hypothetical protein
MTEHDVERRLRGIRLEIECPTNLSKSPVILAVVAGAASCHHVLPMVLSTVSTRLNVVDRISGA